MDAIPTRDLTLLERAIQAFNSGADPSAGALQRAFLVADVSALSPSEPVDGQLPKVLALDGGDGETYLQVFTHDDRIDLEVAKRYPVMLKTTGDKMLGLATGGMTINPGSDRSLAVAVKAAGVDEMRELVRARHATEEARAARAPHEIEEALAAVDRAGMDGVGVLRFGADLWPATLFVPSSRPLGSDGDIELDACFTFGPDDDRMLAAFTDRDQLGDYASTHLLEITGGELFHRLPTGTGIFFNPQRA
ncbi:MAG: SseB family protein, partial [Pseudolysinimonas sp.]